MFCAYRSKRRDHIIRHAARVHEALVAEKVAEGAITGATDAFIDEGEVDESATVVPAGTGESLLKPLLVNKNNNVSGDSSAQQVVFEDDDTAEESDHDSDYDEDAIPSADDN